MLAPEIVEIRHQRRNVGHGGRQVPIDGAGIGKLHRMPFGPLPDERPLLYAPARVSANHRDLSRMGAAPSSGIENVKHVSSADDATSILPPWARAISDAI